MSKEYEDMKEELNCCKDTIKELNKTLDRCQHQLSVLRQICLLYMKSNTLTKEEFCNALRDVQILNTHYATFDKSEYQ